MAESDDAIESIAAGARLPGATAVNVHESAQVRALLQLRDMILGGELAAGSRIVELAIVERLGVSRTPIRAALLRLEQEGLLAALPGGGYAVRSFSERDILDAIVLRGTLEGLLARLAAERSAPAAALRDARQCLRQIDKVIAPPELTDESLTDYVALNARFHNLFNEMAGSSIISRDLERVMGVPFASPSAFVVGQKNVPQARDLLVVAQDQHWQVLEAIESGEGSRAEAIMREHSRLAQRNLQHALQSHDLRHMPGVQLIRRHG